MSLFERPVLVVDDSEVVRAVLADMLRRFGFRDLCFASSVPEALDAWSSAKPGIILLDITMPEVPGTRVATHILREDPHAKIIVVSALSRDAALVESVIALGVYDYLRKPVRQADLEKVLRRIQEEDTGEPGFHVPTQGWGEGEASLDDDPVARDARDARESATRRADGA